MDTGVGARQETVENLKPRQIQDNDQNERMGRGLNEARISVEGGAPSSKAITQQEEVRGGKSYSSTNSVGAEILPMLLKGECIIQMYQDMTYLCPHSLPSAVKGTLVLTNYRLNFKSDSCQLINTSSSGSSIQPHLLVLDVPLGFVSNITKFGGQKRATEEHDYGLEIVCKDIRSLRFAMSKFQDNTSFSAHTVNSKGPSNRGDIYQMLQKYSFPNTNHFPLFAFQFEAKYPPFNANGVHCIDGWKVYNPVKELKRQGVPNESWRLTKINMNYDLSDTYPETLAVPKSVSDEDLREVAKFRSRGRLPVLSWMHPDSKATICRCSQPLVGISNKRSPADENMVQQIMDANAESYRIYIMDARPRANAVANIVKGGGYESENNYPNLDLFFLDVGNIHVMRESLLKVKEICFPLIDDQKWIHNVDNTQWLNHIHQILKAAVKIVDAIENKKTSVITHCSGGSDRTPQLTSLAMMFLDPYYRTLLGFQVLIEKEWLSFGHKFADRIGVGDDKHDDNARSPIFLQFVDCVWQGTNQFPSCFEFNDEFLKFVLDQVYSCLFGTFLYNSEKERKHNEVRTHTQSLWSFINQKRDLFLNPSYRADVRSVQTDGDTFNNSQLEGGQQLPQNMRCIIPQFSLPYLKLWTGYYCRWNPRMRPQDSIDVRHSSTQHLPINEQLRSIVKTLKTELETIRTNTSAKSVDFDNGGDTRSQNSVTSHGDDTHGSQRSDSTALIAQFESVNI